VARVDLDRPLPDLSPERADGGLVHWFHAGRPVGKREIEFGGAPLTAAELTWHAPRRHPSVRHSTEPDYCDGCPVPGHCWSEPSAWCAGVGAPAPT
jgi:hypothetical protein